MNGQTQLGFITSEGSSPVQQAASGKQKHTARPPKKWSMRVDLPQVREAQTDANGLPVKARSPEEIAAACAAGGKNLFGVTPREPAVVILGSEGQGIPDAQMSHVRCRITIPRAGHAESLNVATAAAVICAEWKRGVLSRSNC